MTWDPVICKGQLIVLKQPFSAWNWGNWKSNFKIHVFWRQMTEMIDLPARRYDNQWFDRQSNSSQPNLQILNFTAATVSIFFSHVYLIWMNMTTDWTGFSKQQWSFCTSNTLQTKRPNEGSWSSSDVQFKFHIIVYIKFATKTCFCLEYVKKDTPPRWIEIHGRHSSCRFAWVAVFYLALKPLITTDCFTTYIKGAANGDNWE